MHLWIGLAVLVVLGAVALALKELSRRGPAVPNGPLPYRGKDHLFSKAEQSFYLVLLQAIGAQWRVFPKMRLLDLVWFPHGTPHARAHRNRIMSKHIDFVLATCDTFRPALVIELDDASHEAEDRAARDSFVDQVLRAAGIPILHVAAQRAYVVADLAAKIRGLCTWATVAAEKSAPAVR